ncbi:biotin carboxylase [Streptococcus pluranimalium]|uniref:biotin carboxylase n=1 Tax=Streptococcus pluranimalium TaxID=82348 RepID=UPI003BF7A3A4
MKYFIYRYNPTGIGIKTKKNLSIICPEYLKNSYLELSFSEESIFTIDNFDLPDLMMFFYRRDHISDIFTLDEGLMHIVGILKSVFTDEKDAWKVNLAYKDKKMMRQILEGKVLQPKLLNPNETLPKEFMIKPRSEASGKGVSNVSKVPDYYNSKDYLLETTEVFDTMFTCDGVAVNGKITYFFTHEYVGNVLDIKNKFYNIIKTNSKYNDNTFINRLQEETQKVISLLGIEEVVPFHAEFFYHSAADRLSFCEIGKRFGGGNIPLLIKQAFQFDILEAYWQLKSNGSYYAYYTSQPERYASTIAIFQNGKKQYPPTLPVEFDYFREYPEKSDQKATSLEDLRYLVSFSADSSAEFEYIFDKVKGYLYEQGN